MLVLVLHGLPEASERLACLDPITELIAHTARDDQGIACMLIEKLVHLDVRCVRQSVPHDLIDADHPAVIVTLVFFAIADAFVTIRLSAVEAD